MPLVSVVLIFLNAEQFIAEAIESVLAQSYENWELLLVDDGSTDGSTKIARQYAAEWPHQVHYLEHTGHVNQGMSASRNLGSSQATGRYVAFLDADDVWLPHKLQEQTALLEANPEAGMLYGQSLYWYSWTQRAEDSRRDFVPVSGLTANTLIVPPRLLARFLRGKVAVPCPSSILLRRSVLTEVGGFVESFTGAYQTYEDQAFYSKVALQALVLACNNCWVYYRQHPQASTAISQKAGQETAARQFFLSWLEQTLRQQGVTDEALWRAWRQEQWLLALPGWLPEPARPFSRWVKKWLLRMGWSKIALATKAMASG